MGCGDDEDDWSLPPTQNPVGDSDGDGPDHGPAIGLSYPPHDSAHRLSQRGLQQVRFSSRGPLLLSAKVIVRCPTLNMILPYGGSNTTLEHWMPPSTLSRPAWECELVKVAPPTPFQTAGCPCTTGILKAAQAGVGGSPPCYRWYPGCC